MTKAKKVLLSMTGFGRGQCEGQNVQMLCEIRCVNHRGLDVKFRLPRILYAYEAEFQKALQQHFQRGRLDVSMDIHLQSLGRELEFDADLAEALVEALVKFQHQHPSISPQLSLGDILGFRDLFTLGERESASVDVYGLASQALHVAVQDALSARATEGQSLTLSLTNLLAAFAKTLQKLAAKTKSAPKKHLQELTSRLRLLVSSEDFDSARLVQEAALIADKSDVHEEIERLEAHLAHFRGLIQQGGAQGRKLDFLCQEMFREANTVGSKISDTQATYLVVDLKSEIERIREQVQNIE